MNKKYLFLILTFLILILTGCGGVVAVDNYVIAFIQEGPDNIVRIRSSGEDPTDQWNNGGLIDGNRIPGKNHSGAGLGGYSITMILGTLVGDTIKLRVGLGAGFDINLDEEIPNAASSPSIAHIDGGEYLVAYRTSGDLLSVRPYLIPGDVKSDMAPITDRSKNDFLVGRPALAYLPEEKLVLAIWFRNDGHQSIEYALGMYPLESNGFREIGWIKYGEFPITESGYRTFYGSTPSLATDGENFYLGITRQEVATGGSGLYNPELFIYKSQDGENWTEIAVKSTPIPYTVTNIAVKSNGEILVGMIASGNQQKFYLVRDGNWTQLDDMDVLGRDGGSWEFEIVVGTILVNE